MLPIPEKSYTWTPFSPHQASELLPDADTEIDEVTVELIENVAVVSEQLVMATDNQVEAGLLPLDLNSTNNIVAQVRVPTLHSVYILSLVIYRC